MLFKLVHPNKLFKQAPNLVNTSTDSLIYKTMVLVMRQRQDQIRTHGRLQMKI